MNIIFTAEINTISTLRDGTLKIVLSTNELDSESFTRLFELRNTTLKTLLSNEGISQTMVEELEKVAIDLDDKGKSPAQRQKAVLYRLWETDKEGYEDSYMYYRFKVEKNIEHYKGILTERTS